MKKTAIILLFLVNLTSVIAQHDISSAKMGELDFYLNYRWNEKSSQKPDSSVYRSTLIKRPAIHGVAYLNRSYDASQANVPLQAYLAGISGWDPVDSIIRFIDVARTGMFIEGTVANSGDSIQYDFTFAGPGGKGIFVGRDILIFNNHRDKFAWLSYMKSPESGVYDQIWLDTMVRAEPVSNIVEIPNEPFGYNKFSKAIVDSLAILNKLNMHTWRQVDDRSKAPTTLLRSDKIMQDLGIISRSYRVGTEGKEQPHFVGFSAWDPYNKQIKFLSFSQEGVMVRGSITSSGHEIVYTYEISAHGNKSKVKGKDTMTFANDKEFVWRFYKMKDEYWEQYGELIMRRN